MMVFSQGDANIVLNMTATDQKGNLIDLSGAVFQTQIKGAQSLVTIDNTAHTADPDQVTNKGKFKITMTLGQCNACKPGDSKDIVTKIVQSGVTIHYHGKDILTVLPSVPLE